MTVVELGDSQVSIDRKAMTATNAKESQRGINRGDMSITELEESQLSIDRGATSAIAKFKESLSNSISHEAMAVVDVGDGEGEAQNQRMHFNQHDTTDGTTNEGHSCGDQHQVFAESDTQKAVLDDRHNGKFQQEVSDHFATDGQAELIGGMLAYDGVANERIPDMEGTQCEVQDTDEDASNYDDQIEVWLKTAICLAIVKYNHPMKIW